MPVEGTDKASPFDDLQRVRPDGSEYWSGRELMPIMAYGRWHEFMKPLKRAMQAAANQNIAVSSNFCRSTKVSGRRGPVQEDYELSRFAAYLVAMNGDPNKPQVAAAQAYFAIRTREAETRPVRPAVPQNYAEALREAANQYERAELAEARTVELAAKVEEDEPYTEQGKRLVTEPEDKKFRETARLLGMRDTDLRELMRELGWIEKHANNPTAYARRLAYMTCEPYEYQLGSFRATGYITPKGKDRLVREIHKRAQG